MINKCFVGQVRETLCAEKIRDEPFAETGTNKPFVDEKRETPVVEKVKREALLLRRIEIRLG